MSRQVFVAMTQFCADDDRPRRLLQEAGFEVRENASGRPLGREELLTAVRHADAVLAGQEVYDAEILEALPRLRCISRCGVGTDRIDLQAASKRGVAVLTTATEVVDPVAEMTVAMMLALARNLSRYVHDVDAGLWQRLPGHLLSEWTVGLVGFGRIGRAVHRQLAPFGPRVVVTDPNVPSHELPTGVTILDLKSLLGEADLVSLHASRLRSEGPLIGRTELAAMKSGGRLVNTSRGYLVDEAALLERLESGHLAAAALDVYAEEPYAGPLAHLPQVLCTPHVATFTTSSRSAMELGCAQNVVDFCSADPQPRQPPCTQPHPQKGDRYFHGSS